MSSKNKVSKQDIDSIVESLMEKQKSYFEARLAQIQQVGIENDQKLSAIHAELASLTASISTVKSDVDKLKCKVENNCSAIDGHDQAFGELELKMADMEDRSRRCNIRVIGLKERLEGSNAIQYLTHSLPKWFPALADVPVEVMSAHRIYSDAKQGDNRTLIFNVLRYTTRQAILRAAKKDPLSVDDRKVRFSPDYSNFTVKRRQAFHQAMDAARNKCLDFFLLYPATLKIKEGAQYRSFTSPKEAEDYVNSAASNHAATPASPRQHVG